MHPMLNAQLLLDRIFTAAGGGLLNHLHLCGCKRLDLVKEAGHGRRMSIGLDQRIERLHQMPRRTVHLCLEAGVNIMFGSSPPSLSAGDKFEFDYALAA